MTIILAIPTKNGAILASDGQITAGEIRTHGKKIRVLNRSCIWGAAGREALIQRAEEKITATPNRQDSLMAQRDKLAQIVRDCTLELFNLDRQPPQDEFVFVEYQTAPFILHITTNGTPEWIKTGPFGIGIGRTFVHALLQKYQELIPEKINVEIGTVLAFKVIEEAIEVGAYGLGSPIDIWQITESEVKNLTKEEMERVADSCKSLRGLEIRLFLGNTPHQKKQKEKLRLR